VRGQRNKEELRDKGLAKEGRNPPKGVVHKTGKGKRSRMPTRGQKRN